MNERRNRTLDPGRVDQNEKEKRELGRKERRREAIIEIKLLKGKGEKGGLGKKIAKVIRNEERLEGEINENEKNIEREKTNEKVRKTVENKQGRIHGYRSRVRVGRGHI